MSSTTQHSTARGPTPTRSPAPAAQVPSKPDYTAFSAFGSSQPISQSASPQPGQFQKQQQQPAAPAKPQTPAADPFAALQSSIKPAASQQPQKSMFDFATPQPPANNQASTNSAGDDDEWAFSSALPEGLPSSAMLTVSNTTLRIALHASRDPPTSDAIKMNLLFSNTTEHSISELTFMAAVTKVGWFLLLEDIVNDSRDTRSSCSRKAEGGSNHTRAAGSSR
jgi:ADP-ribosylation factor-binding protein GGA